MYSYCLAGQMENMGMGFVWDIHYAYTRFAQTKPLNICIVRLFLLQFKCSFARRVHSIECTNARSTTKNNGNHFSRGSGSG